MSTGSKAVADYLARLSAPQQEIACSLRALVHRAAPTLAETMKWKLPCYTGQGNVCSIIAYADHVNLAFFRGAELADPDGLLEGTGQGMRHVKVRTVKGMPKQAIRTLIREAAQLDRNA